MRLFISPMGLSILISLSAKEVEAAAWALRTPHLQHSHPITDWGSDWEERAGNALSSGEIYSLEAVMRDGQQSGCLQQLLSTAR